MCELKTFQNTSNDKSESNSVLFRVEFPFPMPTWNRILAMRRNHRLHLKSVMKELCCAYILSASGSQTSTEYAPSGQSTASLLAAFLKTIRPNSSKRSSSPKSKGSRKEPLLLY